MSAAKVVEVSSEEEEVFRFLFDLQESGVTNMFDSPRWIMVDPRWHHLFKRQVDAMVMKWMKNHAALRKQLGYAPEKPIEMTAEEEEIFRFLFERSTDVSPGEMYDLGTTMIMQDERWKHMTFEEADAHFTKWCDNQVKLEKQLFG